MALSGPHGINRNMPAAQIGIRAFASIGHTMYGAGTNGFTSPAAART